MLPFVGHPLPSHFFQTELTPTNFLPHFQTPTATLASSLFATGYTLVKMRHSRVPLLMYSVKRTQLIGQRPLSPCRVRKTAGYTLPRLLFSRTVPRFSEMYPDLAGSGTLPSAIFSGRITLRSQQRTPKPKSSCCKQVMATGIACLGGRSAPTKEYQNIDSSPSLTVARDG